MNIQSVTQQEAPQPDVASRSTRVVFLPDGYNGHTVAHYAEPVIHQLNCHPYPLTIIGPSRIF